MNKEDLPKLIVIVCILLFMLSFIFLSGNNKEKRKENMSVSNEIVNSFFSTVNDNYSLDIDEYINDEVNKITYYNDSNIELYEISGKGYLYYKNKLFELNEENKTIKKIDNKSFVNNPYYDFKFIKSLINKCDSKYINEAKVSCKIKLSDYLLEYNNYYGKNIISEEDEIIDFTIVHFSNKVSKIIVDYSKINNIINGEYLNVRYGIKINNIGKNDFNEVYEQYKKELNK